MDVVRILGVRPTSYERDGQRYSGYNVYFGSPIDPKTGGKGVITDRCFLSPERFADSMPEVGKDYHLEWNRFGKVSKFHPINK